MINTNDDEELSNELSPCFHQANGWNEYFT